MYKDDGGALKTAPQTTLLQNFCFYYNHESDTQLWNLQDVLWSVNALLSALVHDENLGLLLSTTPGRSEEFVGHKTTERAALLTGAIVSEVLWSCLALSDKALLRRR